MHLVIVKSRYKISLYGAEFCGSNVSEDRSTSFSERLAEFNRYFYRTESLIYASLGKLSNCGKRAMVPSSFMISQLLLPDKGRITSSYQLPLRYGLPYQHPSGYAPKEIDVRA